jgi:hypothetical protein
MTREEALYRVKGYLTDVIPIEDYSEVEEIIKALEQEFCGDAISRWAVLDEINRIGIKAFETYNDYSQLYDFIDTLPPVIPQAIKQQPFINKPCISEGVCREDKIKVLDKIRAEIMDTGAYEQEVNGKTEFLKGINYCLNIIDKYKVESEDEK